MKQTIVKINQGLSSLKIDKIIKNLLKNFHPEDEVLIQRQKDFDSEYIIIDKIKSYSHLKVVK